MAFGAIGPGPLRWSWPGSGGIVAQPPSATRSATPKQPNTILCMAHPRPRCDTR